MFIRSYQVLKTEEAADRFFKVATELCVEACLKTSNQPSAVSDASSLQFGVIDALSKLFLFLIRLADKEASDVRVNLLSRILSAIARVLTEDHEAKKVSPTGFDQRPYFRLLSNLSSDMGVPDMKQEPNPANLSLLSAYGQVYLLLQPSVVPGFAFGWLELISLKSFMPHLLLTKAQQGWQILHRLMMSLLAFLQTFLKTNQLNEPIRKLYKGTLRVILVLLHDFPEFLSDYHLSYCEIIPTTCVQLRNLVLAAYPRSMRPPDPLTQNLKVGLLPEAQHPPRIIPDFLSALSDSGLRARIDSYLATKQPPDLMIVLAQHLRTSPNMQSLITSVVVYTGAQAAAAAPRMTETATSIFKGLFTVLDAEGRYYVLNSIANQLRYPNSHTHFFMNIILYFFEKPDDEFLLEQMTRVLLERLIVHRPHPWGLLVTFIELIKNPRYGFWRHPFTKCAPEIERVLESVSRSCMPPSSVEMKA
jgi:CCR4-NOT transcription complex subunit 1